MQAVGEGYIHQSSYKWQAECVLADMDEQVQEHFERLIEGMKQVQGNRTAKGRKCLRMDRTAQ